MADSKRAIFEEVSGDKPAPKSTPPRPTQTHENWRVPMRIWFITLAILVVVMIAVGGLTRQTDSGLSITEWQLIKGTLPPLSAEDWQTAMQKYRTTDEYKLQNKGMTLAEFKTIFWWEWGHRQLGRFIGLVLGGGIYYFRINEAKTPAPVAAPSINNRRIGRRTRRDRLVDGLVWIRRRDAGCRLLPPCDSSGIGVYYPIGVGVVHLDVGAEQHGFIRRSATQRREYAGLGTRIMGGLLCPNYIRGVGRGYRRGADLQRLADDERHVFS